MTINPSAPFRFKLKESLKDIKNSLIVGSTSDLYDFYFIHVAKAGGSFLRDCLKDILADSVYFDNHELKLSHIPSNKNVVVSCRHPLDRFVSSFYSRLHKVRTLSSRERQFFESYNCDVNKYVEGLKRNSSAVIRESYYSSHQVGRFSSYSYWLRDKSLIGSRGGQITYLFRVEELDDDIIKFARLFGKHDFAPSIFNRYSKPSRSLFPSLKRSNLEFLNDFLQPEYDLVNHLREIKGFPPYTP